MQQRFFLGIKNKINVCVAIGSSLLAQGSTIQHSTMFVGTDAPGAPWRDVGDWYQPARAHDQGWDQGWYQDQGWDHDQNLNQAIFLVQAPPPGFLHEEALLLPPPPGTATTSTSVQQGWDQGWMNPSLGHWVWNPGSNMEDEGGDELFLKGWILVQGFFEWGTCLSWHVQRTLAGGLFWRAVLWRRNGREWLVTSVKEDMIPWADHWKIQHWMIHT